MVTMAKEFSPEHEARIREEMKAAGVTKYGLIKGESRHLASVIHEDEHIGGIIYGRHEHASAMLVATNKRVLFMDHKVLFKKTDEISYAVVSGVSYNKQGGYAGVTLHTRLGDYQIRFVNIPSASRFVRYIEQRQLETNNSQKPKDNKNPVKVDKINAEHITHPRALSQQAWLFMSSHDLGVLSSVSDEGTPHGAAVYYHGDKQGYIYVVTKEKTRKAQNISSNGHAALTVYDTDSQQTLQISGIAHVETNPEITNTIYKQILKPRVSGPHVNLPPILSLPAGNFVVICITPDEYQFTDYKNGILGES